MSSHHPQDQGSPAMVSPPILAPLFTSPLLPTSSPEAMMDTDTIPSASLPLSTASTPMPASSETSLPSAVNGRLDSSTSLADRLRRPSASSIRSHPSILRHTETPPRTPVPNGPLSPTQNAKSGFDYSPQLSKAQRNSYINPASPEQQRRNSQDRRVRSEGISLGQSAHVHRPSFIGTKNPSVLTGGYDTSDSESQSAKENDARKQPPTFPVTASASFHGVNPAHLVVQERRRRAQSLMSPLVDDHSPSGDGSGSGRSSIRDRRISSRNVRESGPVQAVSRDRSGSRSSRLNESVTAAQAPNRRNSLLNQNPVQAAVSPTRSRPPSHSPLASAMQSRVPSTYFREIHAESSRHASFATDLPRGHSVEGSGGTAHDLPARSREVERLRREEGVATPSSESSRKGKEKAKETPRSHGLASSLGLGAGSDSKQVMNATQINAMMANSDVAAALLLLQEDTRASPMFSGNSPAARRRSISQHSPEGTKENGLYMPTAPAPLIRDDDNNHRDRTVSISSSIGPTRSRHTHKSSWDDEADIARRRREARRRSSTLGDGEGGHVPFTHHVPIRVDEAAESSGGESGDNENRTIEDRPASSMLGGDSAHLLPPSEGSKEDGKKRKKGRFSGLFQRRKKSFESITREVTRPAEPIPSPASHTSHDHAQSRELYLKDLEIRKIERERRELELADERLYQARVLVQAHPSSSRRAERAISHLRAYYYQVYDSIENPPRLNGPSILRWKKATLEQNENRAKWKAEQAERHKDPTSFPSAWTQVYNSPNSIGSAAFLRPTVSRDSQPMSLSTSGTGHNLRSSTSTHGAIHSDGRKQPGAGWTYTVDDIIAYKEAKGKVDYFMPPLEPPTILSASMNKSQTSQSNKLDDYRPELENREVDLTSSLGSNGRQGGPTPRITSASMLSVAGTVSPNSSHAHLGRTTSNDTASKVPMSPIRGPSRKLGHRTHQSMSAMHGSTTNLANMVMAPLHRLKEGAKRQLTTPYPSGSLMNGSESAIEESPSTKQVRPRTSANTPMNRTPIEPSRSHWHRRGTPNLTDDERTDGADYHGRGAFLAIKGVMHLPHWNRKHDEVDVSRPQSPKSRTDEVVAWAQIAEREKRMGVAHHRRQPTNLAVAAEDHLAKYAAEEYGERSRLISAARGRVDVLTAALEEADQWMVRFVYDVGQIETTSKIRAEIDLEFPDLDGLRERYNHLHRHREDTSGHSTPTSPWVRSPAPSRRGSRRFTNLGPPMSPALYSAGTNWPRRSVLDHHGNRVDPIQQIEIALDEARDKEVALENDKLDAIRKLQVMDEKLNDMINQKNSVREWLDRSNQVIRKKQDQVASMERELNAGFAWSDLLGPAGDRVADFTLRYPGKFLVAAVGWTVRTIVYLPNWWWESGLFGKVFGGLLSVVVLVIGISWGS